MFHVLDMLLISNNIVTFHQVLIDETFLVTIALMQFEVLFCKYIRSKNLILQHLGNICLVGFIDICFSI